MNRDEQVEVQAAIRKMAKQVQWLIGLEEKQSWIIACIAYEYSLPGHGVWNNNT